MNTKLRLSLLLFLFSTIPLSGQTPKKDSPWVKVPDIVVPTPPPPPPTPGAVPKVQVDELYVLDCSEPCFLMVSPPSGIVSVSQEVGPVKVRGKFVGGTGKHETKMFTGKMVFIVEAVKTGRVELIVVKEGAKTEADVFRQLLDANVGPQPPPVPPDPPKPPDPPVPPPEPAPIPAPGLRVLMIYETKDAAKLNAKQREVLFSVKVRQFLDSVCVKEDGYPGYRVYDPNQNMSGESKLWQDAMKRDKKSLPWILISNQGKGGYEGPLPDGADALMELVKKYQ